METRLLNLASGVKIAVPDSINSVTPYVLMEQGDWFEDEIKFLRQLLQPGQQVIDVGANYGVYTLSMAQAVGPTGQVWAFEPSATTAQLLAQSLEVNAFTHVTLVQKALSLASGTAQLKLYKNAEFHTLVYEESPNHNFETVDVINLDTCLKEYSWQSIDFIKIDAEGEESNILRGGHRFFTDLSPLVQYEINIDSNICLDLIQDFAQLGYQSYRLVPGLDLLAPFDPSWIDRYWINLFCCKPERLSQLVAQGYCLDPEFRSEFSTLKNQVQNLQSLWRETLFQFPYAIQLAHLWDPDKLFPNSQTVEEALSWYTLSRDPAYSATSRFEALQNSFTLLQSVCDQQPSHLRLASFARVAQDYGARSVAVEALSQLKQMISQQKRIHLNEPFLAPGKRFDTIPPGGDISRWILAALFEELERLTYHSSYYSGEQTRHQLEAIRYLGFGSAEMERRLDLLEKRFGPPR